MCLPHLDFHILHTVARYLPFGLYTLRVYTTHLARVLVDGDYDFVPRPRPRIIYLCRTIGPRRSIPPVLREFYTSNHTSVAASDRGVLVSVPYQAHNLTVWGFSAGVHGCIGSRFTAIESVRILALLVRQRGMLVPADLDKEDIGPEEGSRRF